MFCISTLSHPCSGHSKLWASPSSPLAQQALVSQQFISFPSSHEHFKVITAPLLHSCSLASSFNSPYHIYPVTEEAGSRLCVYLHLKSFLSRILIHGLAYLPVHLISLSNGFSTLTYKYSLATAIKLKNPPIALRAFLDFASKLSLLS